MNRRYPLRAGEYATAFDREATGERVKLISVHEDEGYVPLWHVRREDGSQTVIAAGYLQAGEIQ